MMIESRNGLHEAISPVSTEKTNELLPRLLVMLAEVLGKVERLHIKIERDGTRAVLDVSPIGELAEIETVCEEERELTPTEAAILDVLSRAEKPIKVITIAHRSKRDCTDYFRRSLYALASKGKVIHFPEHRYWLAERPLPTEHRTEAP